MRARHTQLFTTRAACRASSEPGASSPISVPTRSAQVRHTALPTGEPTTSCVTYAVTKMMACAQARSPAMRARHALRQTCAAVTSATTAWKNQTQVPQMGATHPRAATCLIHSQGLALKAVCVHTKPTTQMASLQLQVSIKQRWHILARELYVSLRPPQRPARQAVSKPGACIPRWASLSSLQPSCRATLGLPCAGQWP